MSKVENKSAKELLNLLREYLHTKKKLYILQKCVCETDNDKARFDAKLEVINEIEGVLKL